MRYQSQRFYVSRRCKQCHKSSQNALKCIEPRMKMRATDRFKARGPRSEVRIDDRKHVSCEALLPPWYEHVSAHEGWSAVRCGLLQMRAYLEI